MLLATNHWLGAASWRVVAEPEAPRIVPGYLEPLDSRWLSLRKAAVDHVGMSHDYRPLAPVFPGDTQPTLDSFVRIHGKVKTPQKTGSQFQAVGHERAILQRHRAVERRHYVGRWSVGNDCSGAVGQEDVALVLLSLSQGLEKG